ncbi:MAG: hypothetical protein EBV34_17955, partial [Betaproteobacteria bacterium]|nr:hypothetical protein [Betaproteobacteria bacterium]
MNGASAVATRSIVNVQIFDDDSVVLSGVDTMRPLVQLALSEMMPTLTLQLDQAMRSTTLIVGGVTRTLASFFPTQTARELIGSLTEEGLSMVAQSQFMAIRNKFQQLFAAAYSSPESFARGLMALNAASKSFDLAGDPTTFGSYFPNNGSPTDNSNAVNAKFEQLSSLAAETLGDVLGADSRANYANAKVIVLTPGSDDVTLTNESEVIATLGGNNRVYA